jgi:hypothetical protein
MSICRRMMVTAVRLVVIILRVSQLGVEEGDFSIYFPTYQYAIYLVWCYHTKHANVNALLINC